MELHGNNKVGSTAYLWWHLVGIPRGNVGGMYQFQGHMSSVNDTSELRRCFMQLQARQGLADLHEEKRLAGNIRGRHPYSGG